MTTQNTLIFRVSSFFKQQTDRQTNRQTNRQTDRQTDTDNEVQTVCLSGCTTDAGGVDK